MKQDTAMPQQAGARSALTAPGRASTEQLNKEKREQRGRWRWRESGRTLLCPNAVTDVRRNVWVVRSLPRVPVEPHQPEAHPSTAPPPEASTGRRG